MARYNKIRKTDVADGPGIRVSVFFQGCNYHCPGCFNENTWDFDDGYEWTEKEIEQVIELAENNRIRGLSILGGEPLHPANLEAATELARRFKETYPDKTVWLWTGNTLENVKEYEIIKYLDVLVDGRFILEKKDFRLKYAGSTNQRVWDLKTMTLIENY